MNPVRNSVLRQDFYGDIYKRIMKISNGMKNTKIQLKLIPFFLIITFILTGCVKLALPAHSPLEENQDYAESETEDKDEGIVDLVDFFDNQPAIIKHQKLPVAIIIDNFSSAWPLDGLSDALVVYEAPVEADITRLLAIFNQDFWPKKIGPVRSARPYFADWATEYYGLFIHAGGSPQVLNNIANGLYDFYDLNEVSGDGIYFWRDSQRLGPHNLYILPESIEQAIEKKNWSPNVNDNFLEWEIKENFVFLENEISSSIIKIGYQEPVIWQFDQSMNSYFRYQNNKSFVDEKGQIRSPNVIIQKTGIEILDEVGRREIKTIGQGEALVFQAGQVIKGTWTKNQTTKRTFFYDQQGEKIKFLPGPIWIEIVGNNHKIFY